MKTQNEIPRAAIISRYAGPTNCRGSRIIVKSQRSRKSYPYPYEMSGSDCHTWAVDQYLLEILARDRAEYGSEATGWGTIDNYSIGVLPSGDYAFVSNL